MIPYIVGKLAPNSSHLTRGLVKSVPGRRYFCAVPSQKGDKYVTSPPPPIVELVMLPQSLVVLCDTCNSEDVLVASLKMPCERHGQYFLAM